MFSKENKINAVLELTSGLPQSIIMKKYGIKGSATLYEWKRRLEQFGVEGLSLNHKKTYFDYSFKMKVIKWRLDQNASLPITAKQFRIKHPAVIWQWERALEQGRLNPNQRRSNTMSDSNNEKSKKELEEENRELRVKLAYLEKLHALVQKKKALKTRKKHK
ncbi:transposase [Pediococcus inopinatus]|jgi:transposase|uniref:Transposase n=4 Tax=Pediococcus inopinatus TaxID=114090 RepID=A0ABZ0Q1Q3_9LACO|nr:helix-turn-helix domain-containing protein [Pediococcus inopinatus]AVK99415.1 transposase [Pediococcus inopinatus]AVL00031.1 transposase [Pediococcus inopinatus]WPC16622.1 transposase [Pediococcus inopinatus]WPC16845.1 transposase [Pediococcus inopinatus]WPC17023.1 transposase [Pediococcus inopinatus]